MRRRLMALLVAAALLATLATTALAQLAPHEHFIVTPSGEKVVIGPRVCGDEELIRGFEEFHANVHENPDFQQAIAQSPNTYGTQSCPQP